VSRMNHSIDTLRSSGAERFAVAGRCLLPNEDVRFICETLDGFLVLTDRRVVLLGEDSRLQYRIERAIPYDCIKDIQQETTDRVKMIGVALDKYGRHTAETGAFEIRAPRAQSGENRTDVNHYFQATMRHFLEVVEEVRGKGVFSEVVSQIHDLSYLSDLPESLTRNAMLDLNAILCDQPVPDELVPEAMKFLGREPFLLEESLRDGDDRKDGVLFAAGEHGYYWVRGKKNGRFMSNVIVDTVEWENILCFVHQWQEVDATIHATYRLTGDGKVFTSDYHWCLSVTEDTMRFPWLVQPMNGLWILADIMQKYSGKPSPVLWIDGN
jgi:hypothetical protein